MSMPALQSFRTLYPQAHITLLVKAGLAPLWKLHAVPDQVICLEEGLAGTFRTVRTLKRRRFSRTFILPHSVRSALIPFLAGIPERIGLQGFLRKVMLTRVITPALTPGRTHQAYEYMDLMLPDNERRPLEQPRLEIPEEVQCSARDRISRLPRPRIALIPGAARGPSKQWPPSHFIQLGRHWVAKRNGGIVVSGSSNESCLCEKVAQGIESSAVNLAGQTSFAEWAAVLQACDGVVANDSGGMHVAAAMGTPVIALYGLTDPAKTGPLGSLCRVLQKSWIRSREVERDSRTARESLAAISPEEVFEVMLELLDISSKL